jgi:hypothetical protein
MQFLEIQESKGGKVACIRDTYSILKLKGPFVTQDRETGYDKIILS